MGVRDWVVMIGMLMLIRVGQTLLLAGCVRSKNAAGLAVRCLLDTAVVLLAVWAVGAIFIPFQTPDAARSWLAFHQAFGNGQGQAVIVILLPALLIATGAVVGATAERTRLAPLLTLSVLLAALLVPVLFRLHASLYGVPATYDFGLPVATIGGGAAALAMAWVVGPRKGKFNRDQSVNFVPGHTVVFQIVGLMLLAAGWAGATRSGLHTLLGLSAALLSGAVYGRLRFGKIDAGLLTVAGVAGLAAAGLAQPALVATTLLGNGGAPAVLAGAAAGVAAPWVLIRIETVYRIDDVAGLAPAYLAGGTIGLLVGCVVTQAETVGIYFWQLVLAVGLWAFLVVVCGGAAYAVAKLFAAKNALRVSETVEYDGLDLSELDVNAYPDFQQTMIKSHHLRQL